MLWGPVFWMPEETGHQEVSSQARMAGKKSNEFTEKVGNSVSSASIILLYQTLQFNFCLKWGLSLQSEITWNYNSKAPIAKDEASYIFTAFQLPIFKDIQSTAVFTGLKTHKAHLVVIPFLFPTDVHSTLLDSWFFNRVNNINQQDKNKGSLINGNNY